MDSLGRTTCLTGTDTVGAEYDHKGGSDVIAHVDGTIESVNAALAAVNTGTLAGQVPGLNLIKAIDAAKGAVTAYETANKAAVDALAATLKVTIATDAKFSDELTTVSNTAKTASDTAHLTGTTTVLTANATDAATAATNAYAALTTAEKALADKYVAAVAAQATAKAGMATVVEHDAVIAGLGAETAAKAALLAHKIGGVAGTATATTLYAEYVAATADQRTAIDKEFKDSSYYSTFKAAVVKDAAAHDAEAATNNAKADLQLTAAGDHSALTSAITAAQSTFDGLTAATPAEKAAADLSATGDDALLAAHAPGTTAASLYAEYVAATPAARALIDTAFKTSTDYAAFKIAADKDAAKADAGIALTAAQQALADAVALDDHTGSVAGNTYVKALDDKTAADTTLATAVKADANVAAVKALTDAYKVQNDSVLAAEKALVDFNTVNKATVATHDLVGDTAGTGTTAAPIKDVFYFADKVTTGDDHAIGSFGAGDSLVVGTSLSYNKGALTAGDNNKSEFFLVQNGKDTLVVLETAKYGSSDVKVDATTSAVTAVNGADHAAIITLTGVAVTDLTVNNGVISHVA